MDTCESVCILEAFTEFETIANLIDQCINLGNNETDPTTQLTMEFIWEKWVKTLDRYQEQPHLIDPYIDKILTKLLIPIYSQNQPTQGGHHPSLISYHTSCKFIYHLSKVRGYKSLIRHFPHQVTDLQIVIDLLGREKFDDLRNWQTRYVLLLWLSLLVTLPFDFKKFDSSEEGQKPLMERIMELLKIYLVAGDTPRIAAAVTASRFLTRPEISKIYLKNHIDWCLNVIDEVFDKPTTLNNRIAVLLSLAYIFKIGKRSDVAPYSNVVLRKIVSHSIATHSEDFLIKVLMKIIQNLGLSLLRVKIASWRYARGRRSILDSLKQSDNQTLESKKNEMEVDNDSEDNYEVPEEVEEVVGFLLDGLRYKSNVVRWSAAKGIGRMTSRLPRLMAGEVVANVCDLLDPSENDGAWHGGCLALAELARRGLILPDQLKEVVPRVIKASVYEESRGNYSVGEHVRDAACYVLWAFSRAYDAHVLRPFLNDITSALLVVSVFDREIKCRRAASAAYQETVGRLGSTNVPNGIEILTTVDNQAVGRTRRAFLELSLFIAQFNDHLEPLIFHLLEKKISHWDTEIRELTSEALANLIKLAKSDLIIDHIVPDLLLKTRNTDLNTKHGSIITLAQVINSMSQMKLDVPPAALDCIKLISQETKQALGFRGIKGELLRSAICLLIEKVSIAQLPLEKNFLKDYWILILKDCVFHTDSNIRSKAIAAFKAFYENYLVTDEEVKDEWIKNLLTNCKSGQEIVRCGSLEALSSLPGSMIDKNRTQQILTIILKCLNEMTDEETKWFEWKVASIDCYTSYILRLDKETINSQCELVKDAVNYSLNVALEDYTTSSKGDIGEPVRIAAIISIKNLTLYFHSISCEILTNDLVHQMICQILVQCVSHHYKMRQAAGENFFELIHYFGDNFQLKELAEVLPSKEDLKNIHLRDETNFSIWLAILPLTRYTYHLWKGLVMSIGGIPSSIVKLSSDALLTQLKTIKSTQLEIFIQVIDIFINVYQDNLGVERMCLQLINTLHVLITSGILNNLEESKILGLIDRTWELAKTTGNPKKKIATVNLLCDCLRFKGLQKKCLSILCIFLCTKYPVVRTNTADALYTALLSYGDTVFDEDDDGLKQEEALQILTETDWNKDRAVLAPIKDKLKCILGFRT